MEHICANATEVAREQPNQKGWWTLRSPENGEADTVSKQTKLGALEYITVRLNSGNPVFYVVCIGWWGAGIWPQYQDKPGRPPIGTSWSASIPTRA